jgi:putative PIN family toxin of toxin-antitoxin system
MIVVVDSGVWISAIEFGGTPAAALERIFLIDDLVICTQIEDEVLRVLQDKFGRDRGLIEQRLTALLSQAMRVEVTGEVKGVCRDPNDDCILECALKAGAELIVSGDKDLLALEVYRTIRLVTCRQYLDLIPAGTRSGLLPG